MKTEAMGRFLVSIECMPVALAEKIPAGFGRSDPNSNPLLPAPTGRLKFVRAARREGCLRPVCSLCGAIMKPV